MPRSRPRGGRVDWYSDTGRYLGATSPGLDSEKALAHLGLRTAENDEGCEPIGFEPSPAEDDASPAAGVAAAAVKKPAAKPAARKPAARNPVAKKGR